MTKSPLSVSVNLGFILLNALIWLVLGIIIALNAHPALPDLPAMKISLAIISIIIAFVLLALTYFLRRQNRTAFYLALVFFVFTCLLTIFDEVGYSDLIFLATSLVPVILLIKDRAWYLQA